MQPHLFFIDNNCKKIYNRNTEFTMGVNAVRYGKNVRQALVLFFQFGIDMLVPICMCSFVGWWLDKWFGTSWIFVAAFFVGAVAGATNVYKFARKVYSDKSGDLRNRDQVVKDKDK